MGLFETTSRILLVARADTRDATRKIKQLEGTQREAAKATLEAQEKQNAALEASIVKLGKLAIAAGVAAIAWKKLAEAGAYYAETQRLAIAAGTANIDRIQDAAQGLITHHEALKFAAAAQNTEFKLSQKEMELAARFMIVLRNQGNDLADVYTKVTKAIVEANAEGLRPFGVIVEGTTGKLSTQRAILAEFEKQIRSAKGPIERLGDEQKRLGVLTTDVKNKFKEAAGWIEQTTLSTLSGSLYALREAGKARDSAHALWLDQMAFMNQQLSVVLAGGLDAYRQQRNNFFAVMDEISGALQAWDERWFGPGGRFGKELVLPAMEIDLRKKRGQGKREKTALPSALLNLRRQMDAGGPFFGETASEEFLRAQGLLFGPAEATAGIGYGQRRKKRDEPSEGRLSETDWQAFIDERTIAQFDAMIERSELLTGALGALQSAGASAWAALITGSKDMAEAFKEAFGQGLLALSSEMFGRALYHGAMALGALAFGNAPAASKHGVAAAQFAAGAVATGALASALGVGGKGAQVPGGGARTPQGGGDDHRSETIIIGMLDDNPRRMRRGVRDMMDRADAEAGPGTTIVRA